MSTRLIHDPKMSATLILGSRWVSTIDQMRGSTQLAIAVAGSAAAVALVASVHQTPIDAGGGLILLAALALLARTLIRLASPVEPHEPEPDARGEQKRHQARR